MLSEKKWKPESVLRLGLGVFLCVVVGSLAASLMPKLPGGGTGHPLARLLAGAIGFQGAALVLIGRFLREHHTGWAEAFGFRRNRLQATLLGAGSACLFMPIGMVLLALMTKIMIRLGLPAEEQAAVQMLQKAGGWPMQAFVAFIAIVLAPVAEEMLFRGIIYPTIKQAGYPRAAWWFTSLLFAAVHFNPPSFLPLLLLAMLLIWLYEKTNNLLAPIAAHSLFNTLNFVMIQFGDQLDRWRLPHA